MDIQAAIKELSNQPLTHQLLAGLLKDYKRPNDKILALKADEFFWQGVLVPFQIWE